MPVTSAAEITAFAELARRRRRLLEETFGGCELKIEALDHVKESMGVVDGVKDVKGQLAKIGTPAAKAQAESLLRDLFDGDWNQYAPLLGPAFTQVVKEIQCFLDAVPCLGSIESGAKAVWHFGHAARRAWQGHKVAQSSSVMRSGDPLAACGAIREVLDRARNENLVKGSINATHASATAGMFFVDGGAISGPVFGAAKAIANLCQSLYLWARDIREMVDGNTTLRNPGTLSSEVFRVSPILGAYLMTESNTSDLLAFMLSDIGLSGWAKKIEIALPHLERVQSQAGKLARNSRLKLEGLQTDLWKYRGLSRFEKFKSKVSSQWEKAELLKSLVGLFK
jgi:hypothetical protein